MNPEFPCRDMPTRRCPTVYNGLCGPRPCARYGSKDPGPWLAEMTEDERARMLADPGNAIAWAAWLITTPDGRAYASTVVDAADRIVETARRVAERLGGNAPPF